MACALIQIAGCDHNIRSNAAFEAGVKKPAIKPVSLKPD
jgi:hypothetical protein